jgi:hypothetical protein
MPADAHHSSVHHVIELYRFGDELLAKALQGLSREDLLHRAGPTSNPLIWMAGHIGVMRFRIGNILGQPEEVPMENLFGGPSKAEDIAAYPHLLAVRDLHHQATERLFSRLRAATPELLAGPAPSSGKSVGETVNLLAYHEGLHVGQMLFLRKLLGHPANDPLMD